MAASAQEEGRPSRWKDGLDRSFVHGSTHHFRNERGAKHLARGALGPWARGVGSLSPRAPETMQVERRLAWRTIACPPKDQPRSWLRLLEQGPESQSAFWICWGGVSSVMGSSDLDELSFVPFGHKVIGIKAHCLQGIKGRVLVWRARSTISGRLTGVTLGSDGCHQECDSTGVERMTSQSPEAGPSSGLDSVAPEVDSTLNDVFAAFAAREASRCCRWASRNAAGMSRVRSVIDWRSRQLLIASRCRE